MKLALIVGDHGKPCGKTWGAFAATPQKMPSLGSLMKNKPIHLATSKKATKSKPSLNQLAELVKTELPDFSKSSDFIKQSTEFIRYHFSEYDHRFARKVLRHHFEALLGQKGKAPVHPSKDAFENTIRLVSKKLAAQFFEQFVELYCYYEDVSFSVLSRFPRLGIIFAEDATSALYDQIRNTGIGFLGNKTSACLKWHAYKVACKIYRNLTKEVALDSDTLEYVTCADESQYDDSTCSHLISDEIKFQLIKHLRTRTRRRTQKSVILDVLKRSEGLCFDRTFLYNAMTEFERNKFSSEKTGSIDSEKAKCAISKRASEIREAMMLFCIQNNIRLQGFSNNHQEKLIQKT